MISLRFPALDRIFLAWLIAIVVIVVGTGSTVVWVIERAKQPAEHSTASGLKTTTQNSHQPAESKRTSTKKTNHESKKSSVAKQSPGTSSPASNTDSNITSGSTDSGSSGGDGSGTSGSSDGTEGGDGGLSIPLDPGPFVSCMTQNGPTLTLSGSQSDRYRDVELADNTKLDFGNASWTGQWPSPIVLGGGSNICLSGGILTGTWDSSTPWDTWHGVTGIKLYGQDPSVENVHLYNLGDGISVLYDAESFSIKRAYLSYLHDDCIENDHLYGGVVDDSLLDGCYSAFSARRYSSETDVYNGSSHVWTIKNSLIRLQDMPTVYKDRGRIPGHDGFFKWDTELDKSSDWAPQLSLHNNIFRVDSPANNVGLGLPAGKLTSCSNNIMVWLGSGSYPDPHEEQVPLPATFDGHKCFTITTDKSIWDRAVAQWKQDHGY